MQITVYGDQVLAPYRRLLSAFAQQGHRAFIGGGAVRDAIFGREIRDVDVFVMPHMLDEDLLREATATQVMGVEPIKAQHFGYVLPDVAGQFVYERGDLHFEVNVVPMRDFYSPVELAERMDFGICQAVLDAASVLHVTEAWVGDMALRKFTLTDPEKIDRSLRRWERLSAKYPEFRLDNPFAEETTQ